MRMAGKKRRTSKGGGRKPPKRPEQVVSKPEGDDERERFDADRLSRVTAPPELDNPDKRARWKLEEGKYKRGPYLIELNVQFVGALPGAASAFLKLHEEV